MRCFLLILFFPFFLSAQVLEEESSPALKQLWETMENFDQAKVAIQETYRIGLVKALKLADSAEIYLLDFETIQDPADPFKDDKESPLGNFKILPYQAETRILKQRKIKGETLQRAITAISTGLQIKNPSGGAFCHYPIHGIRFLSGDEILFETSLCWKCSNLYIRYPDAFNTATWIETTDKMEIFFKKEMPIPQSEIDRFNKKSAPAPTADLHIQKCSSGINYPTEGDESIDISYGDHTFHMRIYHPKVIEEPHFSTPLFWVSEKEIGLHFKSFTPVKTHLGGLSWHSINGYFFADKKSTLRGFFLENGFDNADNGSSGLIFTHHKNGTEAWRWVYDRDPNKRKGSYQIMSADDPSKPAPASLRKTLSKLLDLAEKEADSWPGP